MHRNESFDPLARKYKDTVFRVAFSFMKNAADADDVTQETLIQLYRTDRDFQSEEHVRNWLIRVAVNRCKKLLRSPWRRVEPIADYAETLGFEDRKCSDLFSAVMALETKYRTTVFLHYYVGYSAPELSRLLGVPENTVYTRLSRARARLKDLLTEAD